VRVLATTPRETFRVESACSAREAMACLVVRLPMRARHLRDALLEVATEAREVFLVRFDGRTDDAVDEIGRRRFSTGEKMRANAARVGDRHRFGRRHRRRE